MSNLIEVRNMVSITKMQASINEYGADYTGGDTSKVISYELWVNAETLADHNASATGIFGYQFEMGIDSDAVQDLDWSVTGGTTFGTTNTSITFNSATGAVAVASSGAIVDTDPGNDGPPNFLGSESKIATFYLNPVDQSAEQMVIAFNNALVVTDAGNIEGGIPDQPEVPNTLPVAADDSSTVAEDGSVTIDVKVNDTDTEGDAIVSASATNGSVVVNGDSTITYTPNTNFNGTDTITYTLDDTAANGAEGGTSTATVTVDVTAVNDAPVAANDSATTAEDTSVTISVLNNDSDLDGDVLSVTSASATNGTVTINADSTLTYTGNANSNGSDTITYTITDGTATATATVNVTVSAVNDAPVAANDSAAVHEDSVVTIDVLGNDTDAEDDTLSVSAATAANGAITINADGTLEYTGNTNFNGTDTITYTVVDGNGGSTNGSVTVDVIAVNDDPVANADTASTSEDTAVTINAASNDTDADGDAVAVASASANNGTVVVNADGSMTYTPDADANGTDTITYVASDGVMNLAFSAGLFDMFDPTGARVGGADDVSGTMSINMATGSGTGAMSSNQLFYGQAWSAHAVTVQMTGESTMNVNMLFDWGVTTNIEVTVPMSMSFNEDGTANFATVDGDGDGILGNVMDNGPFAGFTAAFGGTASFTAAPESVSTVTVDITAVNDAPVATNDTASADEDVTTTIDVLTNDSDVDGDSLTVTSATALSGTVSINADGTLDYTGNANYNGSDTITYTVTDGNGAESTSTVDVTVNAVNDAPVANTDATTADESKTAIIDVIGNDTDIEGDTLSVSSANALLGTVTINADGTITYQGGANYDGADTIIYTVSDGNGGETQGTVQVSSGSVVTVDNSSVISSTAAASQLAGYNPTTEVNLVKFDVFVDASVLALYDNITGVSFDISTDEVDFIGTNDAMAHFSEFNTANGGYFSMGFDVVADSIAATVTPEKVKVGTFYADPKTDASEVDITLSNIEVSLYGGHTAALENITATLDANISVEFDATSNTGENIVEDTSTVTGTVQTSDVNNNAITFTGDATGVYGAFTVDATTGTWEYALDNSHDHVQSLKVGEVVTENFTINADDGFGGTDALAVTVTVTGTNDAPIANSDSGSLNEDSSVVINVLGNDTDVEDDALTITSASANDGTVAINADGTLTYTGNLNFNGADTISYTVTDINGAISTSTVSIDVAEINDAPVASNDFTSSREEVAVVIDVLANDNDLDGDNLTVVTANAANGSVIINADGTVTYTPDLDFIGSDTVFYSISDGEYTDSAVALVNVSGTNDTPIANADTATAAEETSTTINVLGNDTDVDGDALAVSQATADNGTVSINADGTLQYTANQDFNGTDTINYTVTDGVMNIAFTGGIFDMIDPTGAVINGADDVVGTMSINMATGSGTGTMSSNQNFYGQPWTAHAVNVQMTGESTMVVDMLFDWGVNTNIEVTVPMSMAFNPDGTASFVTTDGDADGLTGNAMLAGPFAGFSPTFSGDGGIVQTADESSTVTVEVTTINDAPVSNDDSAATNEDAAVTIDVLGNDTDVDRDLNGLDDVLTVTSASANNGSVTINADGTLEYLGNADFNGTDTITYTINDGEYDSTSSVTVEVARVNDAPVAGNDTAVTEEETAVVINPLTNDTDIDVGDVLTITSASAPNGTVVINADGTLTYTGNTDFSDATDTITYTISDGAGGTDTATVDVFVGIVNDAPIASNDSALVHEDTAVTINVLGNDTDIDINDVVSVVSASAANGTVTINADGTLEYTGDQNFNGTDTITYVVTDNFGAQDTATVTVDVVAVNDAPVTTADTAITNEDTAVTIDATANDTDADGDAVGIVQASAENGTVTVNADGTLEYQGNQDFNGTDTITYAVSDGTMNMAFSGGLFDMMDPTGTRIGGADDVTGTISINMATGVGTGAFSSSQNFYGQPWTAHAVTVQMTGESTMTVDMLFDWGTNTNIEVTVPMSMAFNADGTASFTATDGDGDGILGNVMDNGPFAGFTPAFSGTAAVVVDATEVSTVTVDVLAVNDAPVSADDTASTEEDYSVTVDVLNNDSDVDGDALTITAASAANGTVTINADGTVNYLGNSNFFGTDTITYTISDGDGASSTSTVTVEVAAINDLAVANDDTASTDEDVSITIDALANDTDVDGDALSIASASAENGTVLVNADGTLQYTGDANFFGTDTITYTISDGSVSSVMNMEFAGGTFDMISATGSVLGTNSVAGSLSIDMDTGTGNISFEDGMTFYGSAIDIHDSTITMTSADTIAISMLFDWNGITNIESTVHMQMTMNAEGTAADFTSLDTDGDGILGLPMESGPFEGFTASFSGDAQLVASDVAESSIATITVDVAAVNDGPVANADTASVDEDALVTINVLSNDTDIDRDISGLVDDVISVTSASAANGTVSINADGTLDYQGDLNFFGTDTITYSVTDGQGGTSTSTVTVDVASMGDGRTITDVDGNSLTNFTISLFSNGVDTGVELEVDQGVLYLEDLANTVSFDSVVVNANAFDFINAIDTDDITALMKHKVGLDTLSGNNLQAADADNDGDVDGSDGWAMSGVVLNGLDLVNTFDMTNADGSAVNSLSAAVDGTGLTLVANGDINQSGDFDTDFIVTPDIV